MGLSEIAAGVEVTTEQRERGVPTVEDRGASLAAMLSQYADALPCSPPAAATVVEAYAAGRSVGDAARAAAVPPVTAAKTLHLLGEQVTPLGPTGCEIVRDWIAGELSRSEALSLTGVSEREFALATYVETHDRLEGAPEAVAEALAPDVDRDGLGETMSGFADLREQVASGSGRTHE